MTQKSPGEKVLSDQDATITITESRVVIVSLCDIEKDAL